METELRRAVPQDLPRLEALYKALVRHMHQTQLPIWNDVYPAMCFPEDIRRQRLYVLTREDELLAAFALCDGNPGEAAVAWDAPGSERRRALYLERLGVNVRYLRQGVGSLALQVAKEEAERLGAEALCLFVAAENLPAVRLYEKNGFTRVGGVYLEEIGDGVTLREYGFQTAVSKRTTICPAAGVPAREETEDLP